MINFFNISGIATVLFFVAATSLQMQTANAQSANIAYVNYDNLISNLPEINEADAELRDLNTEWENRLEKEFTAFQAKVQQYQNMAEEGLLSPREIQEKETELEKERETVMGLQTTMERQVRQKRNELLRPLIETLDRAISQVAEENNYNYVLDSSAGDLLFFEEANDIGSKVKERYQQIRQQQ